MKLSIIFIIVLCSFIGGCRIPDPIDTDFIGEWNSVDRAKFIFLNNGTFKSVNLSGSKMFDTPEDEGKKYNLNGTWSISKKGNDWIIQLVFINNKQLSPAFFTQFYIAGKNGIASNKPPWYLYKFIGDPDEMDKYEFFKQ